MTSIPRFSRLAAALLLLGLPAMAQSTTDWAFNFYGGPTSGGLKKVSQDAGYTLGFSVEKAIALDKVSSLVVSGGYQWFPGDNSLVSSYPSTVPATTNPTTYEMRMRKSESGGFQFAAMYRRNLPIEGLYVQAGLQLGFNKTTEKDGGTRIVTDGRALNLATLTSSTPGVLSLSTILDNKEKKTVSIGPKVGVGYGLNDMTTLTLNLSGVRLASEALGTKSGLATELGLSIRF